MCARIARTSHRLPTACWTSLRNAVGGIAGGVGKLYEPIHRLREARAEAKAIVVRAEAVAEASAIQTRALERFLVQETRKQENLEKTIKMATEELDEHAKPEALDEDWLHEWSERAARVSKEEMQALWARVLAKEANKPGSFRRSVLQILSMLEKEDAEAFVNLSRFVVHILGDVVPMVFTLNW